MPSLTNEDMKKRIPEFDWGRTPVGPIEHWPPCLKCAVDLIGASPVPMVLLWGPQGIMIYNDGYANFAGTRHPELLGMPVVDAWPEASEFNRRVMESAMAGESLSFRDKHFSLNRRDVPEDVWVNLDYSPIRDE